MKDNNKFLPDVEMPKRSIGYITKEERYQFQYPIIMKYLRKKVSGWSVGDYLSRIGGKNIALYAMTEFTELAYEDLTCNDSKVTVVCICDKNFTKFTDGYRGRDVIGLADMAELYRKKEIDKILVCSIFHINEIVREILAQGVDLDDIISISTAIYNE